MNKVAIVTGVTGQMGSYFAEYLLAKGYRVVGAVRRLSVPNRENLQHVKHEAFTVEPMDLGDAHSINSLIQRHKPDLFVNCAANSFVGSSWDYPEQHMEYNALGVLRQLEAIRKYSPLTRYVNFGSSEEFGDVQYVPQDEKHPARARSPYGASKIAARQIVKVYRESYNLYALQCWCFNYESERRGEEFVTRKITKAVARIKHAIENRLPFEPLELGNLDAKRDWSHAEDYCDGVYRMLQQDPTNLKEYVLSSNETHTVREFVELAFKEAGLTHGSWYNPTLDPKNERYELHYCGYVVGAPEDSTRVIHRGDFTHEPAWAKTVVKINPAFYRPAEVSLLHGESTLARTELGWKPQNTFQDLVRRMVQHDIATYKP